MTKKNNYEDKEKQDREERKRCCNEQKRERGKGQKNERIKKMSKREGATEIASRHNHEEKMRKGEKIYSGQTVVAEESRRFILLSLQRASLKSTLS